MRVVGPIIVTLAVGAGLVLWSWPRAELQRQKLTQYQPVQATVVRADVAATSIGRYQPSVDFRYQVGGVTYTASGPEAFAASAGAGDLAWARSQIEAYPKDAVFTAYYNPANPAQAFAIRGARFTFYGTALLAAPLAALLLLGLERVHVFSSGPAAMPGGPHDWYRLNIWSRGGGVAARSALLAAGWYGYGGAVVWHYAGCAPGVVWPHVVLLGLYGVVGLAPAAVAGRAMRVAARLADAEVHATLPSFETEGLINVRVRQQARRKVRIRSASISLICLQRTGLFGADNLYAVDHEIATGLALLPGMGISGEHSFSVFRKKLPASTPFGRWRLPRVEWQVEVVTQLARGGAYRGSFPIVIRQSQREPAKQQPTGAR